MVESVRIPVQVAAGIFLSVLVIAWSSGAVAQPAGINIKVTGPGNDGAYVDIAPVGSGSVQSDYLELETSSKGTVTVGPPGSDAPTKNPLPAGIYTVWVESGDRDAGGNYTGGQSFVYIGKDGSANVDFDLTGRPPVDPSAEAVFRIGERAKAACNLVTYQRAINQLSAYAADVDKSMRDLQAAIDAYLRDGAMESVPEPQRTRVAGILLAGGTPQDISTELGNIGKDLKGMPNPLSGLTQAYYRLSGLAAQKASYLAMVQKLQPPPDCPKRTAMYRDSLAPITVGSKGTVGCDAKLKEDVAKTLGGFGGGLGALGGGNRSFGLGGGGSSRTRDNPARPSSSSNEPKISPDPVPTEMRRSYAGMNGTNISFGTNFTDKGFWVSSDIVSAPCQGTFQTAYVQDPLTGKKAGPTDYVLTGLYADWKLTVHWTYDRYVNNQHVAHKEGGWQDSGREILGTWTVPSEGKGVWNDLGWGTAVAGAKGMGFYFPMSYADFAAKPLDIVIHVTNPDQDPVRTTAFGFETMPVMREPGSFGRAPRALPKAPSQKGPPEMVWKTQYTPEFRFTPPPF